MPERGQVDPAAQDRDPGASSGVLARLDQALGEATDAGDVDDVVRALLEDLAAVPGVCRVGLALTEGGGRRLRFTAAPDGKGPLPDELDWCHIDAYDDVPLTEVVRTGRAVHAELGTLEERWPWLVERERERGGAVLAVVPLPGTGSPIGGLMLVLETTPERGGVRAELLEAAARRTAEAVADVRARRSRDLAEELAETEAAAEPGARTASLRLAPEPTAPRRARAFLSAELQAWGVEEEIVETAQLCLSEVVTNAVNHAHTVADVRLSLLEGVLTVLVRDRGEQGEVLEPTREEDPLAVYGRGLMLVEALTDRWGSERDVGGTTVWFALDVDRRADEQE
jgi:anti-sigma regulatory factor (Ser/Thr protein kinase)